MIKSTFDTTVEFTGSRQSEKRQNVLLILKSSQNLGRSKIEDINIKAMWQILIDIFRNNNPI